jgi:hypothetical protein
MNKIFSIRGFVIMLAGTRVEQGGVATPVIVEQTGSLVEQLLLAFIQQCYQ